MNKDNLEFTTYSGLVSLTEPTTWFTTVTDGNKLVSVITGDKRAGWVVCYDSNTFGNFLYFLEAVDFMKDIYGKDMLYQSRAIKAYRESRGWTYEFNVDGVTA